MAITERVNSLASFPLRAPLPAGARSLGLTGHRQTVLGPNRIIQKVEAEQVVVVLVADGRRDVQALLAGRLLDDRASPAD